MKPIKHLVRLTVDSIVSTLGKALGLKTLPCLFNGRWLWLKREMWSAISLSYEPEMAARMNALLGPGDVFFDVGAHIGLWSMYAAKAMGKTGKVVAFEPSRSIETLSQLVKSTRSVKVVQCGVGKKDYTATFFGQGQTTSGSFVDAVTQINVPMQPHIPVEKLETKIRSLDSLTEELHLIPTLIKVDVEGFEFEVLSGAQKLIQRVGPSWLIEVHPVHLRKSGSSDEAVLSLLRQGGYDIEVVDRNPNTIYTILARRKTTAEKAA